jgi:2-polyprenyl-3-methyl-5-hydroxy-6-metoxy-1,4-benzoquinol methylase
MLGPTVDYWVLRPFTHGSNSASEEELNSRAAELPFTQLDLDGDLHRVQKLQSRLQGRLPISPDLRYLDIGCGDGGISLALARLGAQSVTGIDIVPRHIGAANGNANRLQLSARVKFICEDIHSWRPPHQYDVLLSHEALEHIRDPDKFLSRLTAFVTPAGILVLAFGPLFFCPIGDHMDGFFRIPIPWRGAIFSEQAILRLRRERFRPTDPATKYQDISGGLNLMRYSEFLRHVTNAGWRFEFLDVNPQLRRLPPLFWLSRALTRMRLVQDYVAGSVYAVLRRREP